MRNFLKLEKGKTPEALKTQRRGTSNNMRTEQNQINGTEAIEDILNSIYNGSYTQAREEIREALENGVNLLEELEEQENYTTPKMVNFVIKEICQYLANTPQYEARQNVLKW